MSVKHQLTAITSIRAVGNGSFLIGFLNPPKVIRQEKKGGKGKLQVAKKPQRRRLSLKGFSVTEKCTALPLTFPKCHDVIYSK